MAAESDIQPAAGTERQEGLSRHRLGRGVLVAVVSTILVGILVGSTIISYQLGYEAGASRVTPIIMANGEPTKVRPADPGGMKIPNQDKRIYDEMEGGKRRIADKGEEHLVASRERPIESLLLTVRPGAVASTGSPVGGTKPGSEEAPPPKPRLPAPPPAMKAPPRPPPGPVVVKELSSGARAEAVPLAPAAAPPAGRATPPVAPAAGPVPPKTAPPLAALTKTAPASSRKAGSGGYLVQLSSAKTIENARRSWIDLRRRHPDLVRGLSESIMRTDLGARKGVWFRLRAGPFASREAAQRMCRRASARKVACFVVRR